MKTQHDLLDVATLVVAVLGLIAASVAAVFAGWSAFTARDTENRQLRAYLAVMSMEVDCCDGEPAHNHTKTEIVNNGETPAYEVRQYTSWFLVPGRDAPLPRDFKFPEMQGGFVGQMDIGRDQRKETWHDISAGDVQTFAKAQQGQATLYIYGHVDYCDIFGAAHSTAYCVIARPGSIRNCDRHGGEIPPHHTCTGAL